MPAVGRPNPKPARKIKFSIIQTAKAAASEVTGIRSAAEEEIPIIPVAIGGIIIIAIGTFFALRNALFNQSFHQSVEFKICSDVIFSNSGSR